MTAALMGSLIEAVFFLNVLIRVKGLPSALHEKFEVVGRVTDACPFPLRVFPISLPLWSFFSFQEAICRGLNPSPVDFYRLLTNRKQYQFWRQLSQQYILQ